MVEVRPDEVSAILRQQLSGFKSEAELEEVGTVLQVGDGIARIYGLNRAQSGELIEFANGVRAIVLNLEEDNVGAVLMGSSDGIREGSIVKRTGQIASTTAANQFTVSTWHVAKRLLPWRLLPVPSKSMAQWLIRSSWLLLPQILRLCSSTHRLRVLLLASSSAIRAARPW